MKTGKTAEETEIEEGTESEVKTEEKDADDEGAEGAEGESGADETDEGETPDGDDADESTEDEVVVTIGDAAPNQEDEEVAKAPQWVKDLRKTNREQARRIRELEQSTSTTTGQTKTLGPKPTMADPDIDYDAAKFEVALDKWNDEKRAIDQKAADAQASEQQAQAAWNAKLGEYDGAKAKLKVKDFDDAEAIVNDTLSQVQRGIVIHGADNAALVIYALGKNPAKLAELKAITDHVKFAFTIAKLEKDLKVTTRKSPPPPEKVVTGSAPKTGATDTKLEKLRAQAEKTGDYTKVVAYNATKRKASTQ